MIFSVPIIYLTRRGERISVSEEGRDGGGERNTLDLSLDLDPDP